MLDGKNKKEKKQEQTDENEQKKKERTKEKTATCWVKIRKKKVFAHCVTLSLCQLIFGFVKKEFELIIMVKALVLITRAFLEG